MSSIAAFFSSFTSSVHADSKEEPTEKVEVEAEAEEEEPEDLQPAIREECKESAKCAAAAKHFEHCQEKVQSGQGFKGEDCVEELNVLHQNSSPSCVKLSITRRAMLEGRQRYDSPA
ncbi:hypothetical protein CVT24_001346 [Panaeolus cyanescens]|uniref:Ubiquinol-cytochrome C reductase hinge domain-containing protein n=1 Tax=Panaeolus cyanescens TaxID=181874 RepID=A0A409YFX2_9AGAR|nr:hypothetical protein CVT24_001346 [Panaeolus cyanescens]